MQRPCRRSTPDLRTTELHENEIRDYINRAPRRFHFNGQQMVNNTHGRLKWLMDLARGTLHERINRRAGIQDIWQPWQQPSWVSAKNRHHRNELRKRGLRPVNP